MLRSTNNKSKAKLTKSNKLTKKLRKPLHNKQRHLINKSSQLSITTTSSQSKCGTTQQQYDQDEYTPQLPIYQKEIKPLFLLCDIQEPFRQHMVNYPRLITSSTLLLQFAKEMDYDVRVSEQLPLGSTATELQQIIDTFPSHKLQKYTKRKFSMIPDMVNVNWNDYNAVVLFGLEAHVCITQTYSDLTQVLPPTTPIYLVTDAVYSQRQYDRTTALRAMNDATQVTTEGLLYGFMGTAEHPKFKTMLPFVKQHAAAIKAGDLDPKFDV